MEKMGKRNTDNKMMMFMRNFRLSKSCIGKEERVAVGDVLHREYLGMGQDVHKFEDLRDGMVLTGTVRNVTDFGAFVDIGVKHDGLVHISQLSNSFVKNPSDVVSVGDIVKVKVIGIDLERQKVQLSMKDA